MIRFGGYPCSAALQRSLAIVLVATSLGRAARPTGAVVHNDQLHLKLSNGLRLPTGISATDVVAVAFSGGGMDVTHRDDRACNSPCDGHATFSKARIAALEQTALAARDERHGLLRRAAGRLRRAHAADPQNDAIKLELVRILMRAEGPNRALRALGTIDVTWAIRLALDDELGGLVTTPAFDEILPAGAHRLVLNETEACQEAVFFSSTDRGLLVALPSQESYREDAPPHAFIDVYDGARSTRVARFSLGLRCEETSGRAAAPRAASRSQRALDRVMTALARFGFARVPASSIEYAQAVTVPGEAQCRWRFPSDGSALSGGAGGVVFEGAESHRIVARYQSAGEGVAAFLRLRTLGIGWIQFRSDEHEGCREDRSTYARAVAFPIHASGQ